MLNANFTIPEKSGVKDIYLIQVDIIGVKIVKGGHMATILSLSEYKKLKQFHCDKGKHRFRENPFGITWCVICGQLSVNNQGKVGPLQEDDKLIIQCYVHRNKMS